MPFEESLITEEQVAVYKAALLYRCFDHLGPSLHPRSAFALEKMGYIEEVETGSLPSKIREALVDRAHLEHTVESPGPLFPYSSGENERSVYPLAELLFNPERAVRNSVIDRLLLPPSGHILTASLQRKLDNKRDALSSDQTNQWHPIAIDLFDSVNNDWLLNLAGARQSLEMRYERGYDLFMRRILWPDYASLSMIVEEAPSFLSKGLPSIQTALDSILNSGQPFEWMLSEYTRIFGSFLFCDGFSARLIAKKFNNNESEAELGALLLKWMSGRTLPLSRWLVAISCVPELKLDDPIRSQLISEILALISPDQTPNHRFLQISVAERLAKHFCKVIEVTFPGGDGDRISECAWWLAMRTTDMLCEDHEALSAFATEALDQLENVSTMNWSFGRSAVSHSRLRSATLLCNSMLTAGAVLRLIDQLGDSFLANVDSAKKPAISEFSLIASMSFASLQSAEPLFGHERGLMALISIHGSESEGISNSELFNYFHLPDQSFYEELERISAHSEISQLALATQSLHRAFSGKLDSNRMLAMLNNADWREHVFCRTEEKVLLCLFSALTEIQIQKTHDWNVTFPHFPRVCLNKELLRDRRKLLVRLIALASSTTETTSALEALLAENSCEDEQLFVTTIKREIMSRSIGQPAWLRDRLRSIVASLPVDCIDQHVSN